MRLSPTLLLAAAAFLAAGLAFGQTVLAKAVVAAGLAWDERDAHSAIYDAERTADLFCTIVNLWGEPRRQDGR